MKLEDYNKVYFSGIGGIGVSAIARLFYHKGIQVIGSDIVATSITKDLENIGIQINSEQSSQNITKDIDLLVYTPALTMSHSELKKAQELGIPIYSYPEFLGLLSKQYQTIAISGTHGKSTTTVMTGLIFEAANLDPTVIVGSQVDTFDHNLRFGSGKYLIAEACEYRGHMLKLLPEFIALTNIEADHLDYYKDIDDIVSHFNKFHSKVKVAALNIDNEYLAGLARREDITYGIDNKLAHIKAKNITIQNYQQFFDLYIADELQGTISLQVPGIFNIYNALASIAIAYYYKIDFDKIQKALSSYHGCWRRFEVVGEFKEALVVSDYAHHPTAVQGTINAAKKFYPGKRLVVVYQPHQQNRTKELRHDYTKAFKGADKLILSEIYDVAGRGDSENISINDLIPDIVRLSGIEQSNVSFAEDLASTESTINSVVRKNDLLLIMGAGDIDNIARALIQ